MAENIVCLNSLESNTTTKYVISLDSLDFSLLPTRLFSDGSNWNSEQNIWNSDNEYRTFELYVEPAEEPPDLKTTTCHICASEVPILFYTQHLTSNIHRLYASIAATALKRMQAHLACPPQVEEPTDSGLDFCETCSLAVKPAFWDDHKITSQHIDSVNKEELIQQFCDSYIEVTENTVTINNQNIIKGDILESEVAQNGGVLKKDNSDVQNELNKSKTKSKAKKKKNNINSEPKINFTLQSDAKKSYADILTQQNDSIKECNENSESEILIFSRKGQLSRLKGNKTPGSVFQSVKLTNNILLNAAKKQNVNVPKSSNDSLIKTLDNENVSKPEKDSKMKSDSTLSDTKAEIKDLKQQNSNTVKDKNQQQKVIIIPEKPKKENVNKNLSDPDDIIFRETPDSKNRDKNNQDIITQDVNLFEEASKFAVKNAKGETVHYKTYRGDSIEVETLSGAKTIVSRQNYHGIFYNSDDKIIPVPIACRICRQRVTIEMVHEFDDNHIELLSSPMDDYFFRQLPGGYYHCLFCNETIPHVERHKFSTEHKEILKEKRKSLRKLIKKSLDINDNDIFCNVCSVSILNEKNYQETRVHRRKCKAKFAEYNIKPVWKTCHICNVEITVENCAEHVSCKNNTSKYTAFLERNEVIEMPAFVEKKNKLLCKACDRFIEKSNDVPHCVSKKHVEALKAHKEKKNDQDNVAMNLDNLFAVEQSEIVDNNAVPDVEKSVLLIDTSKNNNIEAQKTSLIEEQHKKQSESEFKEMSNQLAEKQFDEQSTIEINDATSVCSFNSLEISEKENANPNIAKKFFCHICEEDVLHFSKRDKTKHTSSAKHKDALEKYLEFLITYQFSLQNADKICVVCNVKVVDDRTHITDAAHRAKYTKMLIDHRVTRARSVFYCETCDVMVLKGEELEHMLQDDTHVDRILFGKDDVFDTPSETKTLNASLYDDPWVQLSLKNTLSPEKGFVATMTRENPTGSQNTCVNPSQGSKDLSNESEFYGKGPEIIKTHRKSSRELIFCPPWEVETPTDDSDVLSPSNDKAVDKENKNTDEQNSSSCVFNKCSICKFRALNCKALIIDHETGNNKLEFLQLELEKLEETPVTKVLKVLLEAEQNITKYKCEICNIEFPYQSQHISSHEQGLAHKQKVTEKTKQIEKPQFYICKLCDIQIPNTVEDIKRHNGTILHFQKAGKEVKSKDQEISNSVYKCEMCNVELPNKAKNIKQHEQGERHIHNKKMEKSTLKTQETINSTYKCKVCDVEVPNNPKNIKEHVEGNWHLQKAECLTGGSKSNTQESTDSSHKCKICDIEVPNNPKSIKDHEQSGWHLQKTAELEVTSNSTAQETNSTYKCQICNVEVPNKPQNIQEHEQGSRHKAAELSKSKLIAQEIKPTNNFSNAVARNDVKAKSNVGVSSTVAVANTSKNMEGHEKVNPYNVSWDDFGKRLESLIGKLSESLVYHCKLCDDRVWNTQESITEHNLTLSHIHKFQEMNKTEEQKTGGGHTCQICNVKVPNGAANIKIHEQGRPHKEKVLALQRNTANTILSSVTSKINLDAMKTKEQKTGGTYYCEICNVKVSNHPSTIIEHEKGHPHKEKVLALQRNAASTMLSNSTSKINLESMKSKEQKTGGTYKCEICNVKVSNHPSTIIEHEKGHPHKEKVLALQRNAASTMLSNSISKINLESMKTKEQKTGGTYNCEICNVKVSNHPSTIIEHEKGHPHKEKVLALQRNAASTMLSNSISKKNLESMKTKEQKPGGTYKCEICNVKVSNHPSTIIEHEKGRPHKENALALERSTVNTSNVISSTYMCPVCNVKVPNNIKNITSHEQGSRHKDMALLKQMGKSK